MDNFNKKNILNLKNFSYNPDSLSYPDSCNCNFQRGELDNFFLDLTNIILMFKNGSIHSCDSLETIYISGKILNYLENGLLLILNGHTESYLSLVMDFEFYKILNNSELSDLELMQLLILKMFIPLIQDGDIKDFEFVMARFCGDIRAELHSKLAWSRDF